MCELPGGRLFLFACIVRKRWAGVSHATHPPAPSPREGESLLLKFMLSTLSFSNQTLYEKGLPFPWGRGRGKGSKPNAHCPLAHYPLSIKGIASSVKSKKKGAPLAPPIILQSYIPTILLKHDVPHRHRRPTRIVDRQVVHTRSAPRIDVDVCLLTVDRA